MAETETKPPATTAIAIDYGITDEMIEAKRSQYAALKCDTPEGVEAVRLARADCRSLRKKLDDRKRELNEDARAHIERVNSLHKKLYAIIESIEAPLDKEKERYDKAIEEKKEAKRKADEAEIAKRLAEKNKAESDRLAAIRLADEEKRKKEQAELEAERAKLAAERAKLEADRKAAEQAAAEAKRKADAEAQAERERIAEAKRLADEAARVERERLAEIARKQAEEQAAIDAEKKRLDDEQKAREKAEADRIAAEQAEKAEKERIAAEQAAAEAKKQADEERRIRTDPDRRNIRQFAEQLSNLERPFVTTDEAIEAMNKFEKDLNVLLGSLENF